MKMSRMISKGGVAAFFVCFLRWSWTLRRGPTSAIYSAARDILRDIQGCGPTFAIFSVVRDIPQPGGDVKAWNIGKKRYQSATVSASLMQLDKEQDKVKSAKLCVVNIINFPKICSSNSFLTSLKVLKR